MAVFKTLYNGLNAVVQVNGFISPAFEIKNGVKQGDALSCGLFVLAMDPLIRNLTRNDHIEGLLIPFSRTERAEIKVLAYADDVTVICRNQSLQAIFEEYEKLSSISGLILNAEKTEVFNLIASPVQSTLVRYMGKDYLLGRKTEIRICGYWMAGDIEQEYKLNVLDKITKMESIISGWARRHLSLNGRMILAKTFVLSQIVFQAQVIEIRKREVKRIEKLIYAFVNGSRKLYGPERIARTSLKAAKADGGINGIDVESFVTALAVKQFAKAAKSHRILGELQDAFEPPLDDVTRVSRAVLRSNYRSHAAELGMPDLSQLQQISGMATRSFLAPISNAARIAKEENLSSLGSLQLAFNRGRTARGRINSVFRSLPRSMANLIRSGSLLQSPISHVWLNDSLIWNIDSMKSQVLRDKMVEDKFQSLKVDLGKVYKRADWPPPGTNYESTYEGLWKIKHPTLRAIRLKICYKDIFSNERRFRFQMADSPLCEICGQVESVEHQLLECPNAKRIWQLYHRLGGTRVTTLFHVIEFKEGIEFELIKSVLIKALLQIDRSKAITERALVMQCLTFLRLESVVNRSLTLSIEALSSRINNLVPYT